MSRPARGKMPWTKRYGCRGSRLGCIRQIHYLVPWAGPRVDWVGQQVDTRACQKVAVKEALGTRMVITLLRVEGRYSGDMSA